MRKNWIETNRKDWKILEEFVGKILFLWWKQSPSSSSVASSTSPAHWTGQKVIIYDYKPVININ